MAFLDLRVLADEQGIAVPADRIGAAFEQVDRDIVAMLREHARRERARAGAEAAVGRLQRDDTGGELAEQREDPSRVAAPGKPGAIANVVGGALDQGEKRAEERRGGRMGVQKVRYRG